MFKDVRGPIRREVFTDACRKMSTSFADVASITASIEILHSASTKFKLKLEEAMHIKWEKPNLNQRVNHVNLTLKL